MLDHLSREERYESLRSLAILLVAIAVGVFFPVPSNGHPAWLAHVASGFCTAVVFALVWVVAETLWNARRRR